MAYGSDDRRVEYGESLEYRLTLTLRSISLMRACADCGE
jgi:hypothetical protein